MRKSRRRWRAGRARVQIPRARELPLSVEAGLDPALRCGLATAALALAIALLAGGVRAAGLEATSSEPLGSASLVVAQQDVEDPQGEGGGLEPTYRPRPPEPEPAYETAYLFALTRGVADSTLAPAAKAPMFLFTIPLDIVLLPVAAIAGLF